MKEIDEILKDVDALIAVYRNPGMREQATWRIRAACESLVALELKPDTGPWDVSEDGRLISSDNFDHDVQLKVSGDFYDDASRRAYSLKLAEQLNGKLPKEPPEGLLTSMAMRYRHDFGIDADDDSPMSCGFTPKEREAVLRVMAQLYEEVSGHGFYKKPT